MSCVMGSGLKLWPTDEQELAWQEGTALSSFAALRIGAAKHLSIHRARPFAARRRDTGWLVKQSRAFLHIDPCLNLHKRLSFGQTW